MSPVTGKPSFAIKSNVLAMLGLPSQGDTSLLFALAERLAQAIDARSCVASSDVVSVQAEAEALARAMDLSDDEIRGVKMAALLRNIGTLAVPEHIVSKPGPLTQEEFQKLRIHPQVGAEIAGGVPFPYPVAPIILCHHERWDGKGYPAGLKGEEIPLGARVLTVADYFVALTSERPYHKAMGRDASLALVQQEAGRALDPRVVKAFVALHAKRQPEPEASPAPLRTSVFEDVALAHQEIYALYDVAQAMGSSLGVSDTMSLIASKLSNLVPFSCCALFLYNEDTEKLRCRFATGVESDSVQQLAMPIGQGVVGWVARNRRPLVNARPSADFEAAGFASGETTMQSALACPLVVNERFIGTISLYHSEPSIYADDHLRLLDRISEQAAAVIYNSIVFEQTQEDALTDPLTQLPNERFLFMHVSRELARAERLKSEVSIVVMDLDDFKDTNDEHGYAAGDRALRDVAVVLRAQIRPYDICVRWFSDKFIVVLSGCGRLDAERKRQEIKAAVKAMNTRRDRTSLRISTGTATFPEDGNEWSELVDAATRRMRYDKGLHRRL